MIENKYLTVNYSTSFLTSDLNDNYNDFINDYTGTISIESKYTSRAKTIGRIKFSHILLGRAMYYGFSIAEICESEHYIQDIMSTIFDSDSLEYKVQQLKDAMSIDILIIERIEILAQYRNKGYGYNALREIINRFDNSVGVIALKAFPLQFEPIRPIETKWVKNMRYSELPSGEIDAQDKIIKFYERLGFELIEGSNIMVINTAYKIEP